MILFLFRKVKDQFYCANMMFCKNTFPVIIQRQMGKLLSNFTFGLHTELVTLDSSNLFFVPTPVFE